jgi:uncharacterized protein (DUF305 family)
MRGRAYLPALVTIVVAAACSGGRDDADTAAADSQAGSSTTGEAGMAMDSAQDPNQQFLRMMVDHHQGLIVMAEQAMSRGSTEAVKAEAREMHTKQAGEQGQMRTMLRTQHSDDHAPTVMPQHQGMIDSLAVKQGTDYDMAFRMNVIQHHREGIQMTDQHMPHLTQPDLRSMAERMKADQQADIQKLESEMGHED